MQPPFCLIACLQCRLVMTIIYYYGHVMSTRFYKILKKS
nr:MAG TPA: hypothetical protein [Caudoviricetes sp.]